MSDFLFQSGSLRQWCEFTASGYDRSVCGVVFGAGDCTRGMPLGGIGTGCVDLNTDGTLGLCSIFNSFAPPRELSAALLELTVAGRTMALTAVDNGPESCLDIRYWGHYPIADIEYGLQTPVSVALRAWAPFIPGDAETSNTPAIFFDVTLRNTSRAGQSGTLACCFPGPAETEAKSCARSEFPANSVIAGGRVEWNGGSYVLVADAGAKISNEGPQSQLRTAVDFDLASGESKGFTFCLAWYVPRWAGSNAHHFRHAYAGRFSSVEQIVRSATRHRSAWLRRIIRWQSQIYSANQFPVWLRDQLVNVLHTITEDSFWAGESIPAERWYRPVGLFGLTESPRTTPHICNPSDWYGILPIAFFFPELLRSLLRLYVHFQLPTGEIPLGVGEGADLFRPAHHLFQVMNSCVHIHLIDRLWQRDRDPDVLREFYPSAAKALTFLSQWDCDGDGLPELDADPIPNQFYGAWPWYGVAVHVSGFWISALAMMERMAAAAGDSAMLDYSQKWRSTAQTSLEMKLWNGNGYLLFRDSKTERQSDTILANQLAGQWCTRLHGLPDAFVQSHVATTVATIEATCMAATEHGALNSLRPNGSRDQTASPHSDGIFTGECLCLAATLVYEGRRSSGEEVAHRLMSAIVLKDGAGWELPNILDSEGRVLHGVDFYQMMILWALPLAWEGKDIAGACAPEGFVGRILAAAANH
jgi:uncharacterized protein (DUF608 family)